MTSLAASSMARRLTAPFARGADTMALALLSTGDAAQAPVAPYDFEDHHARFDRYPEPRYALLARQDITVRTDVTVGYEIQHTACDNPPQNLCNDIRYKFFCLKTPACIEPYGYRGIQVTA